LQAANGQSVERQGRQSQPGHLQPEQGARVGPEFVDGHDEKQNRLDVRGPAQGAVVFDEGNGKITSLDKVPQRLGINPHVKRARFKGQVSLCGVEAEVYEVDQH
jgi:hypothetical protein